MIPFLSFSTSSSASSFATNFVSFSSYRGTEVSLLVARYLYQLSILSRHIPKRFRGFLVDNELLSFDEIPIRSTLLRYEEVEKHLRPAYIHKLYVKFQSTSKVIKFLRKGRRKK